MNILLKVLLIITFNLLACTLAGQNEVYKPCATDAIHKSLRLVNPELFDLNDDKFEQSADNLSESSSSVLYTIPVVFHVIHVGEDEGIASNVSTLNIEGALRIMNNHFSNAYNNSLVDVNIQFCLAQRAPGNIPTNGIVRKNAYSNVNYRTDGIGGDPSCIGNPASELTIKTLSSWNNQDFVNIWVVNKICGGASGYAYLASQASSVGAKDGIVVGYQNLRSITLTHEMGHYLDLYHTFHKSFSTPAGCTSTSCCASSNTLLCGVTGDRCCDTPPHLEGDCSASSCTSNGTWDNSKKNLMSYCGHSRVLFTPDQKTRMRNTLTLGHPRHSLTNSLGCQPPPIPDLVINNSFNGTPTTLQPGSTILVNCTTSNIGSAAAPSSVTKFYLSSNGYYNSGDTYLGTSIIVPALNPLYSWPATNISVTIPAGTPPGPYYIVALADADQQVVESDDVNNGTEDIPITITSSSGGGNLPDLVVQNQSTSMSLIAPGGSFYGYCDTKNIGNASSGSNTLRYYLSTNNSYSANDIPLGSESVRTLTPGAIERESEQLTIPSGTSPGPYFIVFKADADEEIIESNDNNNTNYTAITVSSSGGGASRPDLIVNNTTATAFVSPGSSVSFSCDVKNIGTSGASSSTLKYYLSRNLPLGNIIIGTYLGSDGVNPLSPGLSDGQSDSYVIPSSTPTGTYYILFVADANSNVNESDETNNIGFAAFTVGSPVSGGPDLQVRFQTVSSTTIPGGGMVNSECKVWNAGNAIAPASRMEYYLSVDQSLSANDLYLADDNTMLLNPLQLDRQRDNSQIPINTPPGPYYLLFVADVDDDVTETNELNNTSYIQLQITAPLPNLRVGPSSSSTAATAGAPFTVSCNVNNSSPSAAGSSTLRYYLSTNNSWDASDSYLGSDFVSSLGGNGSSPESETVFIPANTPSGNYYILFYADKDDNVVEGDETDNVAYITITVSAPVPQNPDLIIQNHNTTPSSIVAGNSTTVSCDVKNQGNVSTGGNSTLVYYLSNDNIFDPSDTYLNAYNTINTLAGGAIQNINTSVAIPPSTSSGSHYIILVADANNVISESNENNNVGYRAITVTAPPLPDLICQNQTSNKTTVVAGGTVTVGCEVKNQGTLSAGSSKLRYYLSDDQDYSFGDVPLTAGSDIGALSIGNSQTISGKNLAIPLSTPAGNHYILYYADGNQEVLENNENNNVVSKAIAVTAPSLPDLIVQNTIALPFNVLAGANLNISCSVKNNGTVQANLTTKLKYYLSANSTKDAGDLYLGEDLVDPLNAGTSSIESASLVIPLSTLPGQYYILFCADDDSQLMESNENNNCGSTQINVGQTPVGITNNDIPTVSEWGMLFLGLAFLNSASILLRRRKSKKEVLAAD